MARISCVSLNIERDRHLDLIVPFLSEREPDVVCMQEICEKDVERIAEILAADYVFTPTRRHPQDNFTGLEGECIFSRLPIRSRSQVYYVGDASHIPDQTLPHKADNRAVTSIDLELDDDVFRIATTHFTWTPQLTPSKAQRVDIEALLTVLQGMGEFILFGDFNAPRGGEIFDRLAAQYTDAIPPQYVMSLDADLHRAGREKLAADAREVGIQGQMVDGVFTTPHYEAHEVQLINGVSDHLAIVATLSIVEDESANI